MVINENLYKRLPPLKNDKLFKLVFRALLEIFISHGIVTFRF